MKSFPNNFLELTTIADWVRFITSELNRNNFASSTGFYDNLSDAEALVGQAIQFDINQQFLSATVTKSEKQQIIKILTTKLKTQKPTAYLTNQTWFAGLSFYVDERVLVPRSPIAELIDQTFTPWIDYNQTNNVLDLCTGSACIAIACSYALPHAKIDAVDISPDALKVAKINQTNHGVAHTVELIQSDLFQNLNSKKYDLIISNPPYVDNQDMQQLPTENQHEPTIGLKAGIDGLEIVTKIIAQAKNYLSENGVLIVEVGNSYQALIKKYPELDFNWLEFNNGGHGVFLLTKSQL